MPKGIGYPKKKLKTNKTKKKMNFSSQMTKVNKIMSKK